MSAKRILLVENDEFYVVVIGTFVKLFLQYDLVTTKDVTTAFEMVKAENPDLVLLDFDSFGEMALELAENMRDDCVTKLIPLLALSHDGSKRAVALGGGASAFMQKPFKVHDLETTINAILSSGG